MEAADVVGLSPGFKFDHEDDELVAHFLLPRLQGLRLPFDGVILEDDPLSAPPWKLLDKHKRKEDAFFFAAGQAKNGKGSRQKRTCAGGGCWEGQKVCVDGEKLRVPGSGMEIGWRKYALNFHADGERGSTGWVMHEYAVTAPDELASSPLRLYRIRFSGHGKKRKRGTQDSGGDDGRARAAPRRAMAEDAVLKEYPLASQSVCPSAVVVVDLAHDDDDDGAELSAIAVPEATLSGEGSSGVTDDFFLPDFELPENLDELLDYVDDFVVPNPYVLPTAEGSGVKATADGAAPAGTSSSAQGSSSGVMDDAFLDCELPENIEELLETFDFGDFSVPDPCGVQAQAAQGTGAHLHADGAARASSTQRPHDQHGGCRL